MTTSTKLEELRERLVGQDLGGTLILDASAEVTENREGEDMTRVRLLLTPPVAGETWEPRLCTRCGEQRLGQPATWTY